MSAAIQNGMFCIRSDALLEECKSYVYVQGKVVHSRAVRTTDDSAKGATHGDRVIAAALAWHAAKDRPMTPVQEVNRTAEEIPYGCMAWRFKQREREAALFRNDGWD